MWRELAPAPIEESGGNVGIIGFLIVFPLVAAVLCLVSPNQRLRETVVYVAAACIAIGSIVLAGGHLTGGSTYFAGHVHAIDWVFLIVDLLLCAYVMWRSLNAGRKGIFALACVQALLVCVLEFGVTGNVTVKSAVYIDTLSAIMVLVIGVIGSGICVYAVGYMRDFQKHQDELAAEGREAAPDRQNLFFAVMLAFLSAMFGLVLFNDMVWMLTMWEATTVCSFFLIGYTQTQEATDNAFRQIWMNLLGGIAFTIAVIYMGSTLGVIELNRFVNTGLLSPVFTMLPLALLAFAALTKAAQMPFHSWLLGAMVAPTPTSALLHSSTMVKAGVFLLIRLSPLMGPFISSSPSSGINPVSIAVMLVGCITFLVCSLIAISQTNAKRILAYSTIANLGLIATCAGVGTAEAVWAAIFLLVFHAAAKSLLFLCVGTAEHHIGSRDVECMDALVSRMPKLAAFMALGICGMYIAPFGMLISKWAALGAFITSGFMLIVIMLAFGSAATFFFWTKWLGKVLVSINGQNDLEKTVHPSEWIALSVMAGISGLATILLPFISSTIVAPYASLVMHGPIWAPSTDDLAIMAVMAIVVIAAPLVAVLRAKGTGQVEGYKPYMAGIGLTDDEGALAFRGALGGTVKYEQRNWYLTKTFNENKLSRVGSIVCVVIAFAAIACACGMSYASYFVGSVI